MSKLVDILGAVSDRLTLIVLRFIRTASKVHLFIDNEKKAMKYSGVGDREEGTS